MVWLVVAVLWMVPYHRVLLPTLATNRRSDKPLAYRPSTYGKNAFRVSSAITLLACVNVNSAIPAVCIPVISAANLASLAPESPLKHGKVHGFGHAHPHVALDGVRQSNQAPENRPRVAVHAP